MTMIKKKEIPLVHHFSRILTPWKWRLSLPILSQFLFAIFVGRGTILRIGDDPLLSPTYDTQTNQSPVTCRVSQAAPTDPLRPPLTAPHPLQTPLTTGPRHQPQRPPKDHRGQIAMPPRAVQGPHLLQVSMRVPQLPPGHLPSTPSRVTRWVCLCMTCLQIAPLS